MGVCLRHLQSRLALRPHLAGWAGAVGDAASWSLLSAQLSDEGPFQGTSSLVSVGRACCFPWEAGCSRQACPSVSTPAACGRNCSEPFAHSGSVLRTLGVAQGHAGVMLGWSYHPGHIATPSLRPLVLQVREGPERAAPGLAHCRRGVGSLGPQCPSPAYTSGLPCQNAPEDLGGWPQAERCSGVQKPQENQYSGCHIQRSEIRRPLGAPLSGPAHIPLARPSVRPSGALDSSRTRQTSGDPPQAAESRSFSWKGPWRRSSSASFSN